MIFHFFIEISKQYLTHFYPYNRWGPDQEKELRMQWRKHVFASLFKQYLPERKIERRGRAKIDDDSGDEENVKEQDDVASPVRKKRKLSSGAVLNVV